MADRNSTIPGNQIKDDSVKQDELDLTNEPTDGQIVKINMPAGDFTAIDLEAMTDYIKLQDNLMLNAFRIAINGSLTQFNMIDGIVDEYEDESGIISELATPFSHMLMEDNTDEGTGANVVTNIDTPTYTSGKILNALTLNGSNQALNVDALLTDIALDTIGSFSVWFYADTASGADYIIGFGDASDNATVSARLSGTTLEVRTTVASAQVKWVHSSTISTGEWYHLVIVQDGISPKIYLNASDITNLTTTTDTTAWFADVTTLDKGRIGNINWNTGGEQGYFDGQIDDFRYYQNIALTTDDIALLYKSDSGTQESSFGSSNIFYDSTDDYYRPKGDLPEVFAHYRLNDNLATTNVIDTGSGSKDGTAITNTSNLSITGKINEAFDFDGSTEYFNANPMAVAVQSDTIGSISFWARADSLKWQCPVMFENSTNTTTVINFIGMYYTVSGGVYFQIQRDGSNQAYWVVTGANGYAIDEWVHWTIVQNTTALKLYRNGVDVTPSPTTTGTGDATKWIGYVNASTTINQCYIGQWRNTATSTNAYQFDGKIDDFRYYQNTALSQVQAQTIYNSGNGREQDIDNMTLISDSFTAEAQPDSGRIVLLEEDVDAITLNTDLKVYASRDGGSSWAEGTLLDEGDYDASKRILVADFDFTQSGIGTGTDMEYQYTTLTNKELKIHASSLNWD